MNGYFKALFFVLGVVVIGVGFILAAYLSVELPQYLPDPDSVSSVFILAIFLTPSMVIGFLMMMVGVDE